MTHHDMHDTPVANVYREDFTLDEIVTAIDQFLEYGKQTYETAHHGYFSGSGWAARCLRFHRDTLKQQLAETITPATSTAGL